MTTPRGAVGRAAAEPPAPRRERVAPALLYAIIIASTNALNSGMSAHMIGMLTGLGLAVSAAVWIASLRGIGQSLARLAQVLFGGRLRPLDLNLAAALVLAAMPRRWLRQRLVPGGGGGLRLLLRRRQRHPHHHARHPAARAVRSPHLRRVRRQAAGAELPALGGSTLRLCRRDRAPSASTAGSGSRSRWPARPLPARSALSSSAPRAPQRLSATRRRRQDRRLAGPGHGRHRRDRVLRAALDHPIRIDQVDEHLALLRRRTARPAST